MPNAALYAAKLNGQKNGNNCLRWWLCQVLFVTNKPGWQWWSRASPVTLITLIIVAIIIIIIIIIVTSTDIGAQTPFAHCSCISSVQRHTKAVASRLDSEEKDREKERETAILALVAAAAATVVI